MLKIHHTALCCHATLGRVAQKTHFKSFQLSVSPPLAHPQCTHVGHRRVGTGFWDGQRLPSWQWLGVEWESFCISLNLGKRARTRLRETERARRLRDAVDVEERRGNREMR